MSVTLRSTPRLAHVPRSRVRAPHVGRSELATASGDYIPLDCITRLWTARVLGRRDQQLAHGRHRLTAVMMSNALRRLKTAYLHRWYICSCL